MQNILQILAFQRYHYYTLDNKPKTEIRVVGLLSCADYAALDLSLCAGFIALSSDLCPTGIFYVRKMFFEVGVKGASSFTDVELSASGTMNDVYNVVSEAVCIRYSLYQMRSALHQGNWTDP